MNTYQKKYIRNWLIAVFVVLFAVFNIWALITGVVAIKMIWAGALVILGVWALCVCIYGFIAEQVYNFRLRGVCENDDELNFLKRNDWAFHQGTVDKMDFKYDADKELAERFLAVKRPKWY